MTRGGWKYSGIRRRRVYGLKRAHVFLNLVQDTPLSVPRLTSWGWTLGPYSRNVTRDTESIDTPGPGKVKRRRAR